MREGRGVTVKQSRNGTWFTQFRCKDKFGEEVHKCKRGFAPRSHGKVQAPCTHPPFRE
ncbi:Arm DNA-binding domain-containing protein [Varibaculum cambriense]|uniref:Arm DNA-binding domain-containing protein n=1 Tax=Varibaculum cambriense TaxID=184870 RepID=UPI0039F46144